VFEHDGNVVAAAFDPLLLLPQSMRTQGSILFADGRALAEGVQQTGRTVAAQIPGWPLTMHGGVDQDAALSAWYGTLPLYLFVILGPAVAGAGLAFIFVQEFEKRARASEAVRNLRSMRPVEAKLLVRLADAERNAVEASRSKSEFIAHMSHELRTPLNAVIGFSEIIAQEFYGPAGHPKYGEYARDIGDAGRNLHAKIGDILEFANIEAGRHPLNEEAVDLAALALSCVEEQEGRAFSRRISLSLAFREPGLVRADSRAVRRILANLLANALTYTAEGGIVRLDVHFDEGAGILTLSDSGTGFTSREAAAMGKPFQRFDRPGTVTGAGLGLAIAMELARRMGGTMQLAGGSGHGPASGGTAPETIRGAIMELRLPRL